MQQLASYDGVAFWLMVLNKLNSRFAPGIHPKLPFQNNQQCRLYQAQKEHQDFMTACSSYASQKIAGGTSWAAGKTVAF